MTAFRPRETDRVPVRSGRRAAGVLLHISSLPGPYCIGDFGPAAHDFASWLGRAGFRWWQVLPLCPTDPFYGNSPYRSISSNALSPLFASPELLVADGLLDRRDLAPHPRCPADRADYPAVARWKARLLGLAAASFRPDAAFRRFCADETGWLDDYALFVTLKRGFAGIAWTRWPAKLRDREPAALAEIADALADEVRRVKVVQYLLDRQWRGLRARCREEGVGVIGDLPIYVDHDSADCWTHRGFFRLDRRGRPRYAAGVPPDYFSRTGQLWGNPVYDWRALDRAGFDWWLDRAGRALRLFDLVRLDHFRGLVAYWQVPAGAPTAECGRWVRVPAIRLLAALRARFPRLPFIAEDLGFITPDVERARRRFGLPGMKVAVFGFSDGDSPHRPDRAAPDTVLYSSTHDTNTCRGWYERETGPGARRRFRAWAGLRGSRPGLLRHVPAVQRAPRTAVPPPFCSLPLEGEGGVRVTEAASALGPRAATNVLVRACLESPAGLVVLPAQDLFGLGAESRMNTPATTRGNWQWRLRAGRLCSRASARLRRLLADAGRASPGP